MALGLYKPGQGYWMRVITAAMVGTLFLAMAMWVAGQAKRFAATLPVTNYSIPVRAAAPGTTPASGTRLTLLGPAQANGERAVIGTGVVENFDAQNRLITISSTEVTNTSYTVGETRSVRVDGAAGAAYEVDLSDRPRGKPPVEPILVQGIAASVILIIGAILTYWVTAVRPRTVDFLINTDMEMKKVNWSTRRDIIASTWVVIGSSFLIAAFIFFADVIMQRLFKLIGVLQG